MTQIETKKFPIQFATKQHSFITVSHTQVGSICATYRIRAYPLWPILCRVMKGVDGTFYVADATNDVHIHRRFDTLEEACAAVEERLALFFPELKDAAA